MAGRRGGRGGGGSKLKLGCETPCHERPKDRCDVGQRLDKAGEEKGWVGCLEIVRRVWSKLHFCDGCDSDRDVGSEW
jgi:hypothetical protein